VYRLHTRIGGGPPRPLLRRRLVVGYVKAGGDTTLAVTGGMGGAGQGPGG